MNVTKQDLIKIALDATKARFDSFPPYQADKYAAIGTASVTVQDYLMDRLGMDWHTAHALMYRTWRKVVTDHGHNIMLFKHGDGPYTYPYVGDVFDKAADAVLKKIA